jgi:Xaa-Pro dipeptidase
VNFPPDRERLRALPRELGLDALIAMSPENFTYVAGVFVLTVGLIRPRQAFAIIPADAEPMLVICSIEKALSQAHSWIGAIKTYVEFAEHPMDALSDALRALGLERGKVGLDLDYLPLASHQRLMANLPGLTLVNTADDIAAVRVVKTPDQIAYMEETTKQTHRATLDAMAASRLGDAERDMANRIASNIILGGADGTRFVCFSSGPRTAQAHAHATDRIPVESEIIRFDVGGSYGAWSSDFARTYSTGNPSALQRETYAKLRAIHQSTIAFMKPGVVAEDVFYFSREQYKRHGLPAHQPHVGHSFGIELHENPMLRPGDKTPLRPGMVFNVEPSVFDEQRSCYHIEDMLLVTDGEPRILTLGLPPPEIPQIGQTLTYP